MKTKINLLAAGSFLAAFGICWGQPTVQFHTNAYAVAELAGSSSVMVQPTGETNAEGSVDFAGSDLTASKGLSGDRVPVSVSDDGAISQFQGEVGSEISYQRSPPVKTESGDELIASYRPRLELRLAKPINVIQSQKYPGVEYSGILVQAVKSNPLQLINPFAPARYGNGQANTVRNLVTGEAEGLKLWRISF